MFIYACECGTHVYSTLLGLGMAAYFLPGGVYGQNLYWGLCATFSRVYVRYGIRLGQCEQCILYVYVCVYGGRHVHPSVVPLAVSTCILALYSIWHGGLGGVRSIHECYFTYVLYVYHLNSVWRG